MTTVVELMELEPNAAEMARMVWDIEASFGEAGLIRLAEIVALTGATDETAIVLWLLSQEREIRGDIERTRYI